MVVGNLNIIRFRDRPEVGGLLTLSIVLTLFIGLFTFGNALVEYASPNLNLGEKTRLIASTFFQTPTQKGVEQEKVNGITYLFSTGNEEIANQLDALLKEEKASFDRLFGTNDLAPLTIEIYNDSDVLNENPLVDNVTGYYNKFNRTIHLYYADEIWEHNLLHEYAHYRIHQFTEEHKLAAVDRIPQWFEEGICELIGYRNSTLHFFELDNIVDFYLMDSNAGLHQERNENSDPYLQSYFAVQSLVSEHGLEVIPELLLSKTMDEFYENLERITKKNLVEFQQSFLDDLVAERKVMDEKFALIQEANTSKNYEQAEVMINEIIENGHADDIERANHDLLTIYLSQHLFEEAILLWEKFITNAEYGNRTIDLARLAELYLLIDSEKAVSYIEMAKDEVPNDHWIGTRLDQLTESYRLINSDNPIVGYNQIFENDIFFFEEVRTNLHERLVQEFPGKF